MATMVRQLHARHFQTWSSLAKPSAQASLHYWLIAVQEHADGHVWLSRLIYNLRARCEAETPRLCGCSWPD
eukprot:6184787-Pleurochrysis_carterae.AAC.2